MMEEGKDGGRVERRGRKAWNGRCMGEKKRGAGKMRERKGRMERGKKTEREGERTWHGTGGVYR